MLTAQQIKGIRKSLELALYNQFEAIELGRMLIDELSTLQQQNSDLQYECAWVGAHQEDARRSAEYWKNHYFISQQQNRRAVEALEHAIEFIDILKEHGVTNWSGEQKLRDTLQSLKDPLSASGPADLSGAVESE